MNYNGTWHPKGDVFPIADGDSDRMSKCADLTVSEDAPEQKETKTPEPAKRGRRRKE